MKRIRWFSAAFVCAALVLQERRPLDARAEDPSTLQRQLAALEADPLLAGDAAEPIARSRQALARAEALESKDFRAARLAIQAASEWHAVAADLARAVRAEQQTEQLEKELSILRQRLSETRALVTESVARRDRLQVLVRRLEQEEAPASPAVPSPSPAPERRPKP